jgi:tryptophan synthase alpha chain
MPYFTLGYPSPDASVEILEAIARSGADLIELGIPFSDPLADGPTIQRSTQIALDAGMNAAGCLEIVSRLRARGVEQPLLLMGYYNPILAYGSKRFVEDAAAAGADGFIVPDLPLEEAGELEAACQGAELALVYLAAPTSTDDRLAEAARRTTGLLYLVSLTGVTGARSTLSTDLKAIVERVRARARTPLAVGFGISTPEQARAVARLADGVIVGSALINAVGGSDRPAAAASDYLMSLREALESSQRQG